MIERPLILFATPTAADKEKKHGGFSKFYKPSYDRQKARISPKFAVLQNALERGHIRMSTTANSIEPEYTLVLETIGDVNGFSTAIKKLKEQYHNVEWLMELSSCCPNDDDFYALDNNNNRDDNKQLSTKIFCVLTSQSALAQIISLWDRFKTNEHFQFNRGLTGFKHLFSNLKDVHLWGIQERIEDTGLIQDWQDELNNNQCDIVKAEIELFYRTSTEAQSKAEQKISNLISSIGGKVITKSLIPEIQYHALLTEIPKEYAQQIITRKEVDLVLADEIMFMKASGQTITSDMPTSVETYSPSSSPKLIMHEPIIALFDGMPQENHPLLANLISVDDPDGLGNDYPVDERIHGTSMASLILHGQNMSTINSEIHQIYVRPIMKSQKDMHNKVQEYIPDNILIVDKIHECIRRLFEKADGCVAPSVRIVNLSIGISYREYYNLISPLARLLDWLSYKYKVLFIVSAGNHSNDINLGMDFATFSALTDKQKDKFVYQYIAQNLRNLRLLSPSESINALTIGSVYSDKNDVPPFPNMTTICSDGSPAIYSSYGRGINNSIKPDILYDGGKSFIKEKLTNHSTASWVLSPTKKPGIESAYPGAVRQGLGTVGYTSGTSNSTALISNKAEECFNILNSTFLNETGENIPYEHSAVLIKAMLAHGSSWSTLKNDCQTCLNISGQTTKNTLHQYLGYGITNIDKVKECTKNQITLIGYGNIKQDQAFVYSIPLPFDFHDKKYKRKLTVTLAYLSPINPSSIKYRDKQVWFTINKGQNIAGSREEYDYNAVQRGTLQHEIFETDNSEVWNILDSLEIKVNCRNDASNNDNNLLIPYALLATFEMAPEYNIDVYQSIVEKIHIREVVTPSAK